MEAIPEMIAEEAEGRKLKAPCAEGISRDRSDQSDNGARCPSIPLIPLIPLIPTIPCSAKSPGRWAILSCIQLLPHSILDVVVDDEVQFLFGKTVVLRQQFVDFVDDGLGTIDAK